jgi:hypothetical protein
MRLPKGASYKFISTKTGSIDALLKELKSGVFSGYIRLTVENEEKINDGYLLIKDGELIGAEFQGTKTYFSKKGYKKIENAWKLEGIIDVYSFTEFQIQFSIEENQEALFTTSAKKPSEEPFTTIEKTAVKAPEIDVSITPTEPQKTSEEDSVTEDVRVKRMQRLTLLKKLGLKEPTDDFGDSIVKGIRLPSERELNKKSRELKKEILIRLKQSNKLEAVDIYISPAKFQDIIEFDIDVYVKPLNKKIENAVKSAIENTLKEKLSFPYKKRLKIEAV